MFCLMVLLNGFASIGGTAQHGQLTLQVTNANSIALSVIDPNAPADPSLDAFTVDGTGNMKAKGDAMVVGNAIVKGKQRIGLQTITSGPHSDYALSVDGKIVAKSCYVTVTNWADFVYASNYKLLSLKSRKDFVFTEFHMPYMKSAKEMELNGTNIGETLNGLTHNLEDHDHYIFDHDSRLEKLEMENDALKKKNAALEKRLEKLETLQKEK